MSCHGGDWLMYVGAHQEAEAREGRAQVSMQFPQVQGFSTLHYRHLGPDNSFFIF